MSPDRMHFILAAVCFGVDIVAVVSIFLIARAIGRREGRRLEFEAWRAAWLATRLEASVLRTRADPQPTREAAVAALDRLWERRAADDAPRPDKVL